MNENFVFVRFFRLTAVVCFIAALGACNTNETRPEGASSGAEAKTAVVRHGYACCNLHYSGDWISDSNLAELPFIAVGTPIGVKKIDGNRAYVEINGKPMRLGHDYGRGEETMEKTRS